MKTGSHRCGTRASQLAALLWLAAVGCTSADTDEEGSSPGASLAGSAIEYRFEIGRLYRATYAARTVDFVLLEPEQDAPPRARLPYASRRLRPGLFLVSWGGRDPNLHATFVIDFEAKQLHASAIRDGHRLFFETAEIERVLHGFPDPVDE